MAGVGETARFLLRDPHKLHRGLKGASGDDHMLRLAQMCCSADARIVSHTPGSRAPPGLPVTSGALQALTAGFPMETCPAHGRFPSARFAPCCLSPSSTSLLVLIGEQLNSRALKCVPPTHGGSKYKLLPFESFCKTFTSSGRSETPDLAIQTVCITNRAVFVFTKKGELESFVPTKAPPSPWSKLLRIPAPVRKMKNIKEYNRSTSSVLESNWLGLGPMIY